MGIGHYKHVVAIITTIVKQLSTCSWAVCSLTVYSLSCLIGTVPSTVVLDFFSAVNMHIIIIIIIIIIMNSGRVSL
jgi:hypothetical protein